MLSRAAREIYFICQIIVTQMFDSSRRQQTVLLKIREFIYEENSIIDFDRLI